MKNYAQLFIQLLKEVLNKFIVPIPSGAQVIRQVFIPGKAHTKRNQPLTNRTRLIEGFNPKFLKKRPANCVAISYFSPQALSKSIDFRDLNIKKICFYISFLPLLGLLIDILADNLGSNAIQALHIRLGDWSLRFLCITLAITPIQKITKWRGMTHYRQMFGLFSFFYATLHLVGYLYADHSWVWSIIITDIAESSYIWFGLAAYIVLFLLAITSPNAAKKMLGKSWKKLHRYIYPASIAILLHYFWQLKGNLLEPVFYSAIIGLLLLFRVLAWFKDRQLNRLMIPKRRSIDETEQ
jgi:methionine sulfoxide reductase heme-binding subunit